jgi:hypothetical protein
VAGWRFASYHQNPSPQSRMCILVDHHPRAYSIATVSAVPLNPPYARARLAWLDAAGPTKCMNTLQGPIRSRTSDRPESQRQAGISPTHHSHVDPRMRPGLQADRPQPSHPSRLRSPPTSPLRRRGVKSKSAEPLPPREGCRPSRRVRPAHPHAPSPTKEGGLHVRVVPLPLLLPHDDQAPTNPLRFHSRFRPRFDKILRGSKRLSYGSNQNPPCQPGAAVTAPLVAPSTCRRGWL